MEPDENPFEGVIRETKEETSMDIEILMPLAVDHFVRDDGQQITMITFLCRPLTDKVVLTPSHSEYKWMDIHKPYELQDWLVPIDKTLLKYGLYEFV